jgi:hypothetical protein
MVPTTNGFFGASFPLTGSRFPENYVARSSNTVTAAQASQKSKRTVPTRA